jgi:hypothetical protein
LLEKGVDVNARQYVGTTALLIAGANADRAIVELLLSRHADSNLADQHGDTPLMAAVRSGSVPVVRTLLEAGANPNAADKRGRRAVSWVARTNRTDVLKLLLQRGAEVNFSDNAGVSPIMQAQRLGSFTVLESLRRAGAVGVSGAPAPRTVQSAIDASLKMVQTRAEMWFQRSRCLSCHHTGLAVQTTLLAKQHGLKVDDTLADVQLSRVQNELSSLERSFVKARRTRELSAKADTPFEDLSFALANLALPFPQIDGLRAQEGISLPFVLGNLQFENGRWIHGTARVPIESSDILTTAYAIRTLQRYTTGENRAALSPHIQKALHWLEAEPAESVMDLVGKLCAFSSVSTKKGRQLISASEELQRRQMADGSWAQKPGMNGDAYATGLALVVLRDAGLSPQSLIYRRGVQFLLRTQEDDGSWLVPTRAIPLNGYIESGSPHDKHQFISFAGTCWATMALVMSLD